MRRANAPSASASARGSAHGRERPQPAGGLEQRRRLQLAAPQVALDRDVRRVGVLALQQLARGERRAGVRERAQLRCVLVARELGERPREQQVAGRDRQPAPGRRRHRRVSAPQLRAVDQVVVHERRRVHELDRHGRAHQALLALAGGAAVRPRTRRRARRAAAAGACRRRRSWRWRARRAARPPARSPAPRWRSVRAMRSRSSRPPRRMIASSPSTPTVGLSAIVLGTTVLIMPSPRRPVPAWMATMPPAVSR